MIIVLEKLAMASPWFRRFANSQIHKSKRLLDIVLSLGFDDSSIRTTDANLLASSMQELLAESPGRVSVVVPVHNGPKFLVEECLRAVSAEFELNELVIVNDATTDFSLEAIVEGLPLKPSQVTLIANKENLGYTKSINIGIEATRPDNHILILNSDAVVLPGTLTKLLALLLTSREIATVTPLSSDTGAFSVFDEPPSMDDEFSLARSIDQAKLVQNSIDGFFFGVPTGNGFCMLIRRQAWEAFGPFDEVKFPRGYGEENHFCLRASDSGWKNLISAFTVVLHRRSASFSNAEAIKLKEFALKLIVSEWPDYVYRVAASFVPVQEIRARVRSITSKLFAAPRARPQILFVQPISGGGTMQTSLELALALSFRNEVSILTVNNFEAKLRVYLDGENVATEDFGNPGQYTVNNTDSLKSNDYDKLLFRLLMNNQFSVVHVAHLHLQSPNIFKLAKRFNVKTSFTAHDFYGICPSIYLMNAEGSFCGANCGSIPKGCSATLPSPTNPSELQGLFNVKWRERSKAIFENCDTLFFASEFALKQFSRAGLHGRRANHVIPHVVKTRGHFNRETDGPLRVLLLGNFSVEKGSDRVRKIVNSVSEKEIKFFFAGRLDAKTQGLGEHFGEYDSEKLSQVFEWARPDVGLVPSLMPETFSRVMSEFFNFNTPIVTPRFGAFSERMSDERLGWLIDAEIFELRTVELLSSLDRQRDLSPRVNFLASESALRQSSSGWARAYESAWELL